MRSARAKVLHELGGEPMIARTLRAFAALNPEALIVVVGNQADEVEAAARHALPQARLGFALQRDQRGTGDAARCAMVALAPDFAGDIMIGYGDMPRTDPATLAAFVAAYRDSGAALAFISVKLANPAAYGRVVRDEAGQVAAIVEARDATRDQLAIDEINTGIYLADASLLREALAELKADNAQHEFYLTDIVAIARRRDVAVTAWIADDPAQFAGINSREELAQMEAQIRDEVNRRLMAAGVTIVDPASAYISAQAEIGRDTIIGPNVQILGRSRIGAGVVIEGTAWLRDVTIGDRCHLKLCVRAEECVIGEDCEIGPFANLREGTRSRGPQPYRQFRRDQKGAHRTRHQGQPSELPRRRHHRARYQRRMRRDHGELRRLR